MLLDGSAYPELGLLTLLGVKLCCTIRAVIGGQAISACVLLGDFGRKLTDPAKFAGSAPMPETHVAAALREEMAIVTYGAKGVPSAPPLPS